MRILPVNLNSYNYTKNTNFKNSNPISSNIYFEGFRDVFKKLTPPSSLNEQEQKSAEIHTLAKDLYDENKENFKQSPQ